MEEKRLFEIELGFSPGSTPERAKEQWVESSSLNATRINEKRKLSVGTEELYAKKVADPSITGYQKIVKLETNRHGVTQEMVYARHRDNIRASFPKWNSKLNHAFATVDNIPAKRYKDSVSNTKDIWAKANDEKNLSAVGTRLTGRGAAVIAPYWLTAHPNASSLIRRGTDKVIFGSPYDIVVPFFENGFVSILTQTLAKYLQQARSSEMEPNMVKLLNDRLNVLCQSLVDPALNLVEFATGADSHCDIINDKTLGQRLAVKVSKK